MTTYFCIVRDDGAGKCDSLTLNKSTSEYLLNVWSGAYPERGYVVRERLAQPHADGSVTWLS